MVLVQTLPTVMQLHIDLAAEDDPHYKNRGEAHLIEEERVRDNQAENRADTPEEFYTSPNRIVHSF